MDYMVIDGYAGKYEIGADGSVRNSKTKRETKPYHSSELTGPMVHLLNVKTGEEGRLPVLKMVKDLFGEVPEGWENVNVEVLEYKPVIRRSARHAQVEADAAAVDAANAIVDEMESEAEIEAQYPAVVTVAEVDALLAVEAADEM